MPREPPEMMEWDSSMPGAGAQRVTSITQLYVRFCNYSPLTITVVDVLALVFGAQGASVSELGDYLGLPMDLVIAGLEGIPAGMRCTSTELDHNLLEKSVSSSEELRYYLNYKYILPAAFAHMAHILLALCLSPLPSSYTSKLQKGTEVMAPLPRGDTAPTLFFRPSTSSSAGTAPSSSSHALPAKDTATETTGLTVSSVLRRSEAKEGIYCRVCRYYYALQEFAMTVVKCPTCGADVLRNLVTGIKELYDWKSSTGQSLVSLDPVVVAAMGTTEAAEAAPPLVSSPTIKCMEPANFSDSYGLGCPLAQDPFLVQQALAFIYLYSEPFASINDARCVVDADEILTEAEYKRRLQGRATIADRFRAAYRHPSSVRVALVLQRDVDRAMAEANRKKIAKRANLPPWLSSTTTLASLQKSEREDPFQMEPATLSESEPSATSRQEMAKEKATSSCMERKEGDMQAVASTSNGARMSDGPIRTAQFVVSEFFENDFDDIPLPRHNKRRKMPKV